ncbi:hypothetical protein [Rhodococcus tukisamuensis]|uniref:Lipoprotein n=1 Tax=Rhodococcus tukisamuensis TaxID=168276 RepID=A0A1G7E415_9NOCA|nr:hypothetical protein [Rhodococcus tukisamuensis]SDE58464.1 hypothetical protein SAMN05444580_12233 [Rhodococcus tukisamuensis]
MRIAAAVITASAIVFAVAGCSSNDNGSTETTPNSAKDNVSAALSSAANAAEGAVSSASAAAGSAISSAGAAASTLASQARGAVDTAKVSTFTVAFKTRYPSLAEGRDDAVIGDILNQTCADINANKPESEVVTSLEARAGNEGTAATPEQAQEIYNMAKPLC